MSAWRDGFNALAALGVAALLASPALASSLGHVVRWSLCALALAWAVANLRASRATRRSAGVALHAARARVLELQSQKEAAITLGRSRGLELAGASHDLRQPLHALSLVVGALGQHAPADEAQRLLRHLRGIVDTMAAMFDALLEMSVLDARMVGSEVGAVDVAALLARIGADESLVAAAKGLDFACDLRLPPGCTARTDALLLDRIVRNLVNNAVRHTPRGEVRLCARVRAGTLLIRVADSGLGIPAASRTEVFREFVQLREPGHAGDDGLGLGLAVVRRLCVRLGHGLALRSRPGRGTVFSLRLPLADANADAARFSAARDDLASPGLVPGEVVLLVDAVADSRLALAAWLSGWGCRVVAADGLPGLAPALMTLDTLPRLIVCDAGPGGREDGLAVLLRLREDFNADVPALLLGAEPARGRWGDADLAGVAVLRKPFDPGSLREAIAGVLAAPRPSP